MNRDELERKIIEKAQSDPAFRSALQADPKGAVQAALETLQDAGGSTLSEAELEGIAGGAFPTAVNSQITDSVTCKLPKQEI